MTARRNGWIPDRPDPRDREYSQLRSRPARLFSAITRPSSAYLRLDLLPVVFDQGAIGSCTGHGTGTCLDYVEAKQGYPALLSRLAIYYWARGGVPEDTGASIRDAVKAVANRGAPLESLWPYDTARWMEAPSIAAEAEGIHRREGLKYYRLGSVAEIQDAIVQGFPVVFGMTVFPSLQGVGSDGKIPMPGPDESPDGGHCMAFVGFASKVRCPGASPGAFYTRNSWGPGFGDRGNVWVAYDYVRKYASDFWCVTRVAR